MAASDQSAPTNEQKDASPELSVVVPVHNEAENIAPQIAEIQAALDGVCNFEIVYVDDGSSDATLERLRGCATTVPQLKIVRHLDCAGQSASIVSGVRTAKAPLIATLDGDRQNDPADIPRLLKAMQEEADQDSLLIAGHRARRRDTWVKKMSSKVANGVRSTLLGDKTPDTGCGLKIFTRKTFLEMPAFDHMHRFLPALMIRQGGRVVSVPVNHRPRQQGISKYGLFDRLWVGISDLFGVMWLQRRACHPIVEQEADRRHDT